MFCGGKDRFDQSRPQTCLLQLAHGSHRGPPGRSDHVFQLGWMEILLLQECCRPAKGALRQVMRLITRKTRRHSTISQCFSNQSHVGGT